MTQGIKRALWTTVSLTVLMLGISSAITAAEVLSKQIPRAVKLDPVTMRRSRFHATSQDESAMLDRYQMTVPPKTR